MARRRIGQEDLIARAEPRSGATLTELAALIDWDEIDRHLRGISAAAKGERGWPPLSLFRALLLATWHDLSDIRLAEALDDRTSSRGFCGFAAHQPTPERTAFVRFRRELLGRGLDRALFEAVTRQLETKGVMVRTGTLVDATLLSSASIRRDGEARWAGHRRRKPTHGYKAHVTTDEGAGLIRGVEVTTANVHDAAMLDTVLPPEPGDVYAGSAFTGEPAEPVITARGGRPRTVLTGIWDRGPEALARLTTLPSGMCAAGSRRCSAPGSAVTAYGGCVGSVSPRRDCRSGSRPWSTTCGGRSPFRTLAQLDQGGVCPDRRNQPAGSRDKAPPPYPAPQQPTNSESAAP